MSETVRQTERMIAKAKAEMGQMLRRGILKLAATVRYSLQAEGYDGERFEAAELWQQFGLTSRPPAGGEVMIAKADNDSEQPIAIATTDRAHRPSDLAEGDSSLYGVVAGGEQAQVRARADKDVDVVPGAAEFVNLGAAKGDGALEAALLGASFEAKLSSLSTAMGLTVAAIDLPTVITLANAMRTALIAFSSSSASHLATRVKLK